MSTGALLLRPAATADAYAIADAATALQPDDPVDPEILRRQWLPDDPSDVLERFAVLAGDRVVRRWATARSPVLWSC